MASNISKAITAYIKKLNIEYATGRASERSYYPALQELIKQCGDKVTAHIEQTGERGIPDMPVDRGTNRIGIIEVKDIHLDLTELQANAGSGKDDHNSEQFRQYLDKYDNVIYTNLLEWRRYRKHEKEPVQTAHIGDIGADGKIHRNTAGVEDFEKLIAGFLAAHPEPQVSAKGLALEMARLTVILRDSTIKIYGEGNDYLKGLFDAFQKELIHGLTPDEFADMYAETVAYGLFTARIMSGGTGDFDRSIAGRGLPKTNPFLRRVFKSLADDDNMPPGLVWIVQDLAALIGAAEMGEITAELARFGERRSRGEAVVEHDPIIYFYEHFLRAYDPKKAKSRGVYYTPLPVVSYIVRSIDELLKSEFAKPLGLADPEVIILDPACGTGTFLYEVVRLIHERVGGRGAAYWKNEYVPKLLERLYGFELLMAPYTIAHLKLAELLRETGYDFPDERRLGIYLTNTLEEAETHAEQMSMLGIMGQIAEEKASADKVKSEEPVMVVLGNPPYSGHSANKGKWIDSLLKKGYELPDETNRPGYYEVDGAPLGERQPKWLQDDYVKFLRWAQWRIDRTGRGIVGMITNHGYLDNPTFRGMRQNLMATFDEMYLLDLHGNAKKKETAPDGSKDENVFDIMQGVAVFLGIRNRYNI